MQLLKKIIRLLCTGSHRSTVPTGFVPLSDIRTVVIFSDPSDQGHVAALSSARTFFSHCGISVQVITAADRNIRTKSDLFIAINGKKSIDERYAAAASTARFKIGRHQLRGQVYDVIVRDPDEEPAGSDAAFRAISNILTTIK